MRGAEVAQFAIPEMTATAYLTFSVNVGRYAIPATSVVEIVRAVAVAPLPGGPPVVSGAIDYRGVVLPVLDVARRFSQASRPVRASDRMIIADAGSRRVVLHVDEVDALVPVADSEIAAPPARLAEDVPVAGIARAADGLIVIQDLDRFLSDAEGRQLDTALEGRGS